MPKYSVVIPVFNEEKNAPLLYQRVRKVMQELKDTYEIIFIDDGSTDASWEILKNIAFLSIFLCCFLDTCRLL